MKRIYCLRKKGTEELAVALAGSVHDAKKLAGGKHTDWAYLADCSIGGFSEDERRHREAWGKLAKTAWFKERI